MARPLVSVVIATYRRAQFLPQAVSSALAQTCRDVEVIVVEDGSHDALAGLRPLGGRVQYHWQENRGAGAARNAGARLAHGRWLAFLDDDDQWEPHKLERQLAFAEAHPDLGMVHTDHRALVGAELRVPRRNPPRDAVPSGWITRHLVMGNFIVTSSTMVLSSAFGRAGGFGAMRSSEDLDLWLRLSRVCPIGYLNEPLTIYRDHAQSLSSELGAHLRRREVLERFLRSDEAIWGEVDPPTLRRRMRDVCWTGGYAHLQHGECRGARDLFLAAWRWTPGDAKPLAYGIACSLGRRGVRYARAVKRAVVGRARARTQAHP